MHNVFVSVVRCDSPNELGTRCHNKNAIIYIGTRAGVDLSPLPPPDDHSDNKTYLKYISERPRSHGLFGNYEDLNTKDIAELGRDMYKLSKTKVVYRAIFSLDERDAQELGYTSSEKWQELLTKKMPDVADTLNIPIDKLRWCAAFHNEPGHPHVHCMFWNGAKEIRSPFIKLPVQHAIREQLSGEIFSEERQAAAMQKSAFRDAIVSAGKGLLKEGLSAPLLDVSGNELAEIQQRIFQIMEKLPGKGRMDYQFMRVNAKAEIKETVDCILKNPQIGDAYREYIKYLEQLSHAYSPTKAEHEVSMDKGKRDLYERLGNVILKHIKTVMKDKVIYSSSIDTVMNHHIKDDMMDADEMNPSDFDDSDKEYSSSEDDDSSLKKALSFLQNVAENGNPFAQYKLGKLYSNPDSELLDMDKAISFLMKSASQGNQFALYQLGKIYSDPDNGLLDMDKAISFLMESASQGNQFAQCKLGNLYLWGKGVPQNEELGRYWLQKAIDQDNTFAMRALQMYEQQQLVLAGKLFTSIFKLFGALNKDNQKSHAKDIIKTDSVKAQKDLLHKLNRKHQEHTSHNQ